MLGLVSPEPKRAISRGRRSDGSLTRRCSQIDAESSENELAAPFPRPDRISVVKAIQAVERAIADRCPFRGPFPADFDGCGTYQAVSFTAFDSQGKRLGDWTTCRHLGSGTYPGQRGQFYPRCTLGTADDRIHWLARVSPARLEVVRALQQEFEAYVEPYRAALAEAKAKCLATTSPGTRAELDKQLASYQDVIYRFLEERKTRCEAVGLPIDRVMAVVRAGARAWAASPSLEASRVDEAALGAFAPHFQGFVAEPLETPWRRPVREVESLYEDSILRIVRADGPGLRFMGSIDASNLAAVSKTVLSHIDGSQDCHLDVSGLLFCDVGGLRAIVEAAQRVAGKRRVYLDGLPAYVTRITALAGWDKQPNLVAVPMEQS